MGDAGLLVDGLLLMPAAEGHVVNAVTFMAGGIARAVGDADREQAMRVAVETLGFDFAVLAATGPCTRAIISPLRPPNQRLDASDREYVHIFRHATLRGQVSGKSTVPPAQ